MRHEHLSVTVDAGTKDRIDDDLERGESLEAWVADAIERKLDEEESDEEGSKSDDESAKASGARAKANERGRKSDSDDAGDGYAGGEHDEDRYDEDDYDEGFEYVDDCAI